MIHKIKDIIRKVVFRFIKPPIHIVRYSNTYSQAGEDSILTFLFADKKINDFTYLDIGTNEPRFANNTYLFYVKGKRGVCVEADKTLMPAIQKFRPEDKIIHAGVATGVMKEADFYIFESKGLNTFDKLEAENRAASGINKITAVEKVPLLTINEIIKNNFRTYPDLLSIDIEGYELKVLKSLEFDKYPIPVICAETCTYSENHIRKKDPTLIDFLSSKDYEVYADTYINTIFVYKKWFYTI